jgi:hypothetical protein
MKVNTSPLTSYECGMETPADQNSNNRIILIGASHMTRTAKYVNDSVSLAYPGFRPDIEKIKLIEKDPEELKLTSGDTVVLDLISNVSYMGTTDNGLPTPAFRAGDGSYHVSCSLTTAPPTTIKRALSNCEGLCQVLTGIRNILVCPIPYPYPLCIKKML